jgi:hypothetical protein
LPAEFGVVLSADVAVGSYLPRELWLVISSYTVDPRDAAADDLEDAVAARAYCLTAGNADNAESASLRRFVLQPDKPYWNLITGAFLRLFYAQNYDYADRVGEDLVSFTTKYQTGGQNNIGKRVNLAICSVFRGDYETASKRLTAIAADRRFNAWITEGWLSCRCYWLAQAWIRAAAGDNRRALEIIDRYLASLSAALLLPFVQELRKYLQRPTSDPIFGLTAAHAVAVASLKADGWPDFLPVYPRVVFDAPRPVVDVEFNP